MTQIYKGLVLTWKATLCDRFIAIFISKAHSMKYNSHEVRQSLLSINKDLWMSLCGRKKYKKGSSKFVQRNSNLSTCEDPTYQYCKPLFSLVPQSSWAANKSISDSLVENYSRFANSVSQELQQTDNQKQELSLIAEEYKPGRIYLFHNACSFSLDN